MIIISIKRIVDASACVPTSPWRGSPLGRGIGAAGGGKPIAAERRTEAARRSAARPSAVRATARRPPRRRGTAPAPCRRVPILPARGRCGERGRVRPWEGPTRHAAALSPRAGRGTRQGLIRISVVATASRDSAAEAVRTVRVPECAADQEKRDGPVSGRVTGRGPGVLAAFPWRIRSVSADRRSVVRVCISTAPRIANNSDYERKNREWNSPLWLISTSSSGQGSTAKV